MTCTCFRRESLSIGALAVALTFTACGGGSSGSPTAPTSNSFDTLAQRLIELEFNPTTISIAGQRDSQSFSPNPTSAEGRMFVWRNDDGDTHRIVANDGSFDTGDLAPSATSTMVQIPQSGLNYHCSIHPTTMFGAIGGGGGEAPPVCEGLYCDD